MSRAADAAQQLARRDEIAAHADEALVIAEFQLFDLLVIDPQASFLPVGLHLALVLVAGIWLPPALVSWFQYVATLLN